MNLPFNLLMMSAEGFALLGLDKMFTIRHCIDEHHFFFYNIVFLMCLFYISLYVYSQQTK